MTRRCTTAQAHLTLSFKEFKELTVFAQLAKLARTVMRIVFMFRVHGFVCNGRENVARSEIESSKGAYRAIPSNAVGRHYADYS